MEFQELVKARKSIRGYLNKPVPREVIDAILEVAKWAPSSMNTQPWHVHVVTGEPLDRIRKGNTENMVSGVPPKRSLMKACTENVKLMLRFNCLRPWASRVTTKSGVPIG